MPDDVRVTTSAAQSAAFFREAVREGSVWTVSDEGGYPAPLTSGGQRAQPFWSLRSRAERILTRVPAYAGFVPEEITLDVFRQKVLPDLERHGLLVGVNWSGPRATGYDMSPAEVSRYLGAWLDAADDHPRSSRS